MCGKKHTVASWTDLELVSARWDVAGDGVDVLEMRNCNCGSTISLPAVGL